MKGRPRRRTRRTVLAVLLKVIVAAAALLLLFLLGPRIDMTSTVVEGSLPPLAADLDGYLAEQESRFDDITPGTEKTVIWHGSPGEKTPLAVVYLHGFSATRQETAPLADEIAAELGANLFYTRFRGHGRSGTAMGEASLQDWVRDAWEAFRIGRLLGERVVVMGTSTGGTAAVWLAAYLSEQTAAQPQEGNLAAMVLLSPNFGPADPAARILTWPWGGTIAELVLGPERSWEPQSDLHRQYWSTSYPTAAVLPMMGLVRLVQRSDLSGVSTPTLTLYSPDDQVVSPAQIVRTHRRIGTAIPDSRSRISAIPDAEDISGHVLAGAILAPNDTARIRSRILDFLEEVL